MHSWVHYLERLGDHDAKPSQQPAPRNPRSPDLEDPRHRTAPWLLHRAMDRGDHRRAPADRGRLALPGALPDGAQRVDRGRMGDVRAEPQGQALQAHAPGAPAAQGRDRAVGTIRLRGLEGPPPRLTEGTPPMRWLWKKSVDDEVSDELDLHLELRTREFIARGMDPAA